MATLPVRKLGDVGVVPDVNPYDLPINAFSRANNVLFDEGRISRAPLCKTLFTAVESGAAGTSNLRFISTYASPSTGNTPLSCSKEGNVHSYTTGAITDVSPPLASRITNEEKWTHAQVAGLSFLARKGMVPYGRNLTTDAAYSLLGGEWGADHSASVVRGYLDYCVMFNVVKGSVEYPTMVKWSHNIQYGTALTNLRWNPADTTSNAGENTLAELTSPILEAQTLGNSMVIYSRDQVWAMEHTGTSAVFNFRKLFAHGGVMSANCVAEVEGKHYVLGDDDIYFHDGVSIQSIADGRVRRHIFNNIDRTKRNACFVVHDSNANLIYFCYPTFLNEVGFQNTQHCNQAAVFNYRTNAWSFFDLPNVCGGAEATISLERSTFDSMTGTYDTSATTFNSFEGTKPKALAVLSSRSSDHGLTESRIYALDSPTVGVVSTPVHPETLKPAYVERVGLDLDDMGNTLPLRTYKTIRAIIPQGKYNAESSFTWQFGATDLPESSVSYSRTAVFKPATDYKIDTRVSGRYLAYKITTDSIEAFNIAGFDMEILTLSRR